MVRTVQRMVQKLGGNNSLSRRITSTTRNQTLQLDTPSGRQAFEREKKNVVPSPGVDFDQNLPVES
jgi:hypothetical protein